MKEYKYNLYNLDTVLYKYILDNGLTIYLLPYENKNNYYMHYVTKFGSIDTEFIPIGENKMIKVPDGIAHFLEHKMFEVEDGPNPFEFSSSMGTSCNASTSFEATRYLFEGNNNFKENLNYLISYVNKPYFTDQNVEKEKGIIKEEILQYKDIPDIEIDNMILKNVLKKDNHRIDIGGTVESIMDITKEDLYKTYNTFYHPSNMFLVITGKFNTNDAINIIKNNSILNKDSKKIEIVKKKIKEPFEVDSKIAKEKMNIQSTRVSYSIKIPISKYKGIERYQYLSYFSMMLNIVFGVTSDFRERINKNELVTSFYYDRTYTEDYMIITFFALSEYPNELLKEIKYELDNINIKEEDVERIKKVWIANEVLMIDDASTTLDNIIYDVIEFGEYIYDKIKRIKEMNIEKLNEIIYSVDYNNSSTLIVEPIKKS